MERNETFDPVTEQPHFDDERTIQAAQPVVPLKTIRNRNSLRGPLVLTAALVVAVLLGATAALVIANLRTQQASAVEQPTQEESQPTESATNAEQAPPADSDKKAPVHASESVALSTENAKATVPVKRAETKRKQTEEVAPAPRPTPSVQPDVSSRDADDRAWMSGQWEERRMRRVDREERRRDRHRRDDLFRIREIFEGPRP